MKQCLFCGQAIPIRNGKYCNNKCQAEEQYKLYIASWKRGEVAGDRGILAKNMSGHIKRYLLARGKEQCALCGWRTVHPVTGRVPLEIDHIDGNHENNTELNLRLICPNCHALTPTYRNLNYGKGRGWRKAKYLKNESKSMPL